MLRGFLIAALSCGVCCGVCCAQTAKDAQVRDITRSAILIDTHNDVTSRTVDGFDIGKRATTGHTDIPRLREGGVGAVFFAIYVGATYVKENHSANRALQMIDTVRHDIVGRYPKDFVLALTADDIEGARKQGKIAALMGLEGGHAVEDSPRLVRDFYALGVRYMTLTHTNTNHWADSSGDVKKTGVEHHGGLTSLGKQIIAEMNRIGMMVDVSHVSDKTFWDALETSRAPVFASHSSCRAVSNIPRNMTDEMIAALARKGGVIQINFGCDFLSQKAATAVEVSGSRGRMQALMEKYKGDDARLQAELAAMRPKQVPATLADAVASIAHAVEIAGIDHVGIGSDYDGVTCVPTGLEDVSKFPNLTRALLEKGFSAQDIRKIYGANTLRLMRDVEKTAQTGG